MRPRKARGLHQRAHQPPTRNLLRLSEGDDGDVFGRFPTPFTRSGAASWPTSRTSTASSSPPSPRGRRRGATPAYTLIGLGRQGGVAKALLHAPIHPSAWKGRAPTFGYRAKLRRSRATPARGQTSERLDYHRQGGGLAQRLVGPRLLDAESYTSIMERRRPTRQGNGERSAR